MARQLIGVGTTANDNSGDPIRDAFIKVNAMTEELYADDAADVNSVNAGTGITVNQTTGAVTVTNSAPDQTVALTGGTSITTSGTYPSFTITNDDPNATHTGDVTGNGLLTIVDDKVITSKILDLNVTTAKIADGNITVGKMAANSVDSDQYVDASIDTIHIADDQITHDKLEGRYTALETITTTSGTINLDGETYAAFNLTGTLGTVTLNIQNMKKGQVIDILLSGTLSGAAITLADSFTTSSINKVGTTSLDTSKTNLIQVLCVDDTDSAAILTYAVAEYAVNTTV